MVRERELPRSLLYLLPQISLRSWGHHSVSAFAIINLCPDCNVLLLLKLAPLVTYHSTLRHLLLPPALDRRLMLPVNNRLRIWSWEFHLESMLVSTLLYPGTTLCHATAHSQKTQTPLWLRGRGFKGRARQGLQISSCKMLRLVSIQVRFQASSIFWFQQV